MRLPRPKGALGRRAVHIVCDGGLGTAARTLALSALTKVGATYRGLSPFMRRRRRPSTSTRPKFLSLLRVWRGWRRAHVSEVARGGVAGSTPFSTRHHRRPAVSGEQGGRTDDDYADHSRTQLDSSIEEITIPPAYLWDRLKVVAPLGRRHKIAARSMTPVFT